MDLIDGENGDCEFKLSVVSIHRENLPDNLLSEAAYTVTGPTFTTDVDYSTKYTKTGDPKITFSSDDIELAGTYKVKVALTNARVFVGDCVAGDYGR